MKAIILVITAFLAGLVGGIVGARLAASPSKRQEATIRARSFELVNDAGTTVAVWGFDRRKYPVLAFGDPDAVADARRKTLASGSDLADPHNQRVAIGIQGNSPFLDFRAGDGNTQMRLNLSIYGKPLLWMADGADQRVWLGAPHSDTPSPQDSVWGLYFEPNGARIGMNTKTERGENHVRGFLFVNKDQVSDPPGQRR